MPSAPPTALVLAGGLGTRLRAVLPDRQKVMAEVAGRPFLFHVLDQLADAGVVRAVLCTGYRGDEVRRAAGTAYRSVALEYSEEPEPAGTGGAVRLALPLAGTDPVLVVNGDSYCRMDLVPFFRWFDRLRPAAALVLARAADTRRFGRVDLDPAGRVLRFVEKGEDGGAGWINGGIYLLSAAVARAIPPEGAVSLEREVLAPLAGKGLAAYPSGCPFLDIGTAESFARAEAFFAADAASAGAGGAGSPGGAP